MAVVAPRLNPVCTASSTGCATRRTKTTASVATRRPALVIANGKCSLSSKLPVQKSLKTSAFASIKSSQQQRLLVQAAATSSTGSKEIVEDDEFSISKISFGSIGLSVGLTLLSYGFGAFFELLPGQSLSAVMLIYGFPISLIGFALQYAKLDPVPCITYRDALNLRESQATPIQNQVRSDVTRYRYGDEQHLDEALKRIFQIGKGGGIPRKFCPKLTSLREETVDGLYSLVMVFGKESPVEEFESRQAKFQSFFGPGVYAVIAENDDGIEVSLISDGTNAGASDADEWEVLPPLTPNSPPRRVKKGSVK
mmetsp:Transcript_37095/g.44842  ORF Transcript_37095/g.44842 Transcript_37095/m.44842 type:complete len:310 (-) Transcript_37095:178-1107(-)|eukprot:CAMPEP_0197866414 /NCGR_PEP_ID=MMETSP1438-20131217/44205_1 /TAXON_ID=1461541 /ORGANISM="Pterosperma sp., Strain CCMP1384" /LENGTH=309 /DNA_ID=CAMNT_0043484983 /DNA_START=58 /DNA_END=987 /DNA_ORIENTATION=-